MFVTETAKRLTQEWLYRPRDVDLRSAQVSVLSYIFGCLVGWFVGRLVGRSVRRLDGWLFGWYLLSLEPGKPTVQHLPLEESSKILMSPLNIELGLVKNSFMALDQTGPAFRHLAEKCPGIRAAKSRRVFSSAHRSTITSETNRSTAIWLVTRRGRGMTSGL